MAIAKAASSKKALDIVLIDMRKIPSVADYFIIASGTSTTQVKAIADNIIKKLSEKKEKLWHIEGQGESLWVLLDYGDVVVHIFYEETRRFYCLERLWGDVPQERFKEPKKRIVKTHAKKKKRRSKA